MNATQSLQAKKLYIQACANLRGAIYCAEQLDRLAKIAPNSPASLTYEMRDALERLHHAANNGVFDETR